jgi:hypothetical protein
MSANENNLDYKDLVIIRSVLMKATFNLPDTISEPYRQNAIDSFNEVLTKVEEAMGNISESNRKESLEKVFDKHESPK